MKQLFACLFLAAIGTVVIAATIGGPTITGGGMGPASQTEVNAGVVSNKAVTPLTLYNFSLGQATGGVTLVQVTNISAYEVNKATNALNAVLPHLNGFNTWDNNNVFLSGVEFDSTIVATGKVTVGSSGIASSNQFAVTAPGGYFYVDTNGVLYGNGAGLTALSVNGANIVVATIASNKLAFAVVTPAQLAAVTNYATLINMLGPLTNGLGAGGGGTINITNDLNMLGFNITNVSTIDGPTGGAGLLLLRSTQRESTIGLYDSSAGILYMNNYGGTNLSLGGHRFHGLLQLFNSNSPTTLSTTGNITAGSFSSASSTVGTLTATNIVGLMPAGNVTNAVGSPVAYKSDIGGTITADAYHSTTNANNTGSYVAGQSYFTNLTADITLAPFTSVPASGSWAVTIAAKNTSGSTKKITFPNGVVNNNDGTAPAVMYVTNNTTFVSQAAGYGTTFTNYFGAH